MPTSRLRGYDIISVVVVREGWEGMGDGGKLGWEDPQDGWER